VLPSSAQGITTDSADSALLQPVTRVFTRLLWPLASFSWAILVTYGTVSGLTALPPLGILHAIP
jgi:hypothetical protein